MESCLISKIEQINKSNKLIDVSFLNTLFKTYNLNHTVKNITIYYYAFIHVSFYNTIKNTPDTLFTSNERLEFLGDQVLKKILTIYLFFRYSKTNKGFLTKLRIKLEKSNTIAYLTEILNINQYLLLSHHSEFISNCRNQTAVKENLFEAFIGALYLDLASEYDQNTVTQMLYVFIKNVVESHIDFSGLIDLNDNYKDLLLQHYQQNYNGMVPKYYTLKEFQQNNNKTYLMGVADPTDNHIIAVGIHAKKVLATQIASFRALKLYDHSSLKYFNEDIYINHKIPIHTFNNRLNFTFDCPLLDCFSFNTTPKYIIEYFKQFIENFSINNIHLYLYCFLPNKCDTLELENYESFLEFKHKIQHVGYQLIKETITAYLYNRYPSQDEGFLTTTRIKIENALFNENARLEMDFKNLQSHYTTLEYSGNYLKTLIGCLFLDNCTHTHLNYSNECSQLILYYLEHLIDISSVIYTNNNFNDKLLQYYQQNYNGKFPNYTVLYDYHDHKNEEDTEYKYPFYIIGVYDPSKTKIVSIGINKLKTIATQHSSRNALHFYNKN